MAIKNNCFYYVTGPVHLFVRFEKRKIVTLADLFKSAVVPYSLGHTEKSPDVSVEPQYKPVFSSLSGEAVPDDEVYLGQNIKVVLDLARFDMDIIDKLLNPPFHRDDVNFPVGSERWDDRGVLLNANQAGFELWLQNSFFNSVNKAAYPNLPPGYYFGNCRMAGTYPTNMTRDTKRVRLMIEPKPLRFGITGGFGTFSKHISAFAGLPDPG